MKLKGVKLYYVGGYVRDEFLGADSIDVDYCYEGNAIEFAGKRKLDIIKENPAFGTVRVLVNGKEVDIASTRTETYPRKGHLPKVDNIGCSLEDDLKRRDFTMNAMAKKTVDGEIIDIYNGAKDIDGGVIRVLHDESYIDDPTRIVRALKFSIRFGFELEKKTKALRDEYLENINYDMSYHRLKKEIVETFSYNPEKALDGFVSQGLYKLLGENQQKPILDLSKIRELVDKYPTKYSWLVYLSCFDLSNIVTTKAERRIIEWAERLKKDKPNNNTPFESLLIHRIRQENKAF